MKKAELKALLQDARQLLDGWHQLKACMDKALLTDEEITREEEGRFLEVKSALSKNARTLAQKMPPDLAFGHEKLAEILKNAISIVHFRGIPATEIPQLRQQWHQIWVQLTRTVGGLAYLAEGGIAPPRKAAVSGMKRGKKKKKSIWPKLIGGAAIVGAGAGLAMYMGWI